MVRWYGGAVVRWCGGTVVRWYGGTVVRWHGPSEWWYGGRVACRWLSLRCRLLLCVNIGQLATTLDLEPGLSHRKDKYCLSHGVV